MRHRLIRLKMSYKIIRNSTIFIIAEFYRYISDLKLYKDRQFLNIRVRIKYILYMASGEKNIYK